MDDEWVALSKLIKEDPKLGCTESERWVIHECGGVRDMRTGLLWARKVGHETLTWEEVQPIIDSGGSEGWRIPTLQELFTIVDYTRYKPAIDEIIFPNTSPCEFWTSTPFSWDSDFVWTVDFHSGDVNYDVNSLPAYVRFVRD